MKRFLCSLLIIIVLMGIAGCSSKKSVEIDNTTSTVESTQESTQNSVQSDTQLNSQNVHTEEPATMDGEGSESEDDDEIEEGQLISPTVPDVKHTKPADDIIENPEKKWALIVKGGENMYSLPVHVSNGEPSIPIVAIATVMGLDVEWVSDTEVSLWYGESELYINPAVENLGIYHPLGAGEPIREKIGQDYYIDIPSASFILGQWGGSHISIDSENMILRIQ